MQNKLMTTSGSKFLKNLVCTRRLHIPGEFETFRWSPTTLGGEELCYISEEDEIKTSGNFVRIFQHVKQKNLFLF